MKTPDIKQNPHPTKRYEITIEIKGAPGPFDSVNGFALFQVDNVECAPVEPSAGVHLTPQKSVPLALTRVGNTYKGTFYGDQLLDENYFGLGVCHWALASAGVNLNVQKVVFSAGLVVNEINAQKPLTTYYANASYHDTKDQGGDTGTIGTPYILQHPTEFFSATLAVKEDTP